MKEISIINNQTLLAGFTSGKYGIWSRNEPQDPPTDDYKALSRKLDAPLSRFIRPYQAGGDKVEIVSSDKGGSGVIKDNDLRKVDGLITAEKGLVLSVIAADCVPVFLYDASAGIIGILHCGWRSASGDIIRTAVERMRTIGASTPDINIAIGPHICKNCYEVGEDVRKEYAGAFSEKTLQKLFSIRNKKLYLDLSAAIKAKAAAENIPVDNISDSNMYTFCEPEFYSYRRGDRGKQNLAYIMLK